MSTKSVNISLNLQTVFESHERMKYLLINFSVLPSLAFPPVGVVLLQTRTPPDISLGFFRPATWFCMMMMTTDQRKVKLIA